jgi:hypothetical protein
MADIIYKNFLDLTRLEIKNLYSFISTNNINDNIDNSILWELLHIRQLMSAKIRVSSKDISNDKQNMQRLDYVIFQDKDIIGYFCLRQNKKNNQLNLLFYFQDENLNKSNITILEKELDKIKAKYYNDKIQIKMNILGLKEKLNNLLKDSRFHLDRIDNKTYKEPYYMYSLK